MIHAFCAARAAAGDSDIVVQPLLSREELRKFRLRHRKISAQKQREMARLRRQNARERGSKARVKKTYVWGGALPNA